MIMFNSGNIIHSLPLFRQLGLLQISEIFKLQISKFIHDSIHSCSPPQFKSWFFPSSDLHDHATRRHFDIFIPYCRTTYYGLRSIKILGAKIWNSIPLNIKEITSRNLFSKTLKKIYLSEY